VPSTRPTLTLVEAAGGSACVWGVMGCTRSKLWCGLSEGDGGRLVSSDAPPRMGDILCAAAGSSSDGDGDERRRCGTSTSLRAVAVGRDTNSGDRARRGSIDRRTATSSAVSSSLRSLENETRRCCCCCVGEMLDRGDVVVIARNAEVVVVDASADFRAENEIGIPPPSCLWASGVDPPAGFLAMYPTTVCPVFMLRTGIIEARFGAFRFIAPIHNDDVGPISAAVGPSIAGAHCG
jgi:hypothetical protein